MKYKFTLGIGFVGAVREEIIDIYDYLGYTSKEWSSFTDSLKEEYLKEAWDNWTSAYIDGGWAELEEE